MIVMSLSVQISSGTMTIYDKVDKIYYVSNIQQIKYDADGNATNL